LERSSAASTSRLSTVSTLSSDSVDVCDKSQPSCPGSDGVKRPCHSAGSLGSSDNERSGMTWQQMWHQRLFNTRNALSARGERKEVLSECRRPEEHFLKDAG
jgi:hypothetical protein